MSYRIDIAPNGRFNCNKLTCQNLHKKIEKGQLRLGLSDKKGSRWAWRHYNTICINGEELRNLRKFLEEPGKSGSYCYDNLDNYEHQTNENQKIIRELVELKEEDHDLKLQLKGGIQELSSWNQIQKSRLQVLQNQILEMILFIHTVKATPPEERARKMLLLDQTIEQMLQDQDVKIQETLEWTNTEGQMHNYLLWVIEPIGKVRPRVFVPSRPVKKPRKPCRPKKPSKSREQKAKSDA